jgi:hypothetical protein
MAVVHLTTVSCNTNMAMALVARAMMVALVLLSAHCLPAEPKIVTAEHGDAAMDVSDCTAPSVTPACVLCTHPATGCQCCSSWQHSDSAVSWHIGLSAVALVVFRRASGPLDVAS